MWKRFKRWFRLHTRAGQKELLEQMSTGELVAYSRAHPNDWRNRLILEIMIQRSRRFRQESAGLVSQLANSLAEYSESMPENDQDSPA